MARTPSPSSFEDILRLLAFLLAVWFSGRLVTQVKLPRLVGELVTGSVLGPSLLDLAPEPAGLQLLGEVGLILCVIEAGLSIDLVLLRQNGWVGLLMGATGCFVALLIGFGLASAIGLPVRSALAVGACFAPTSFGVASACLKQSRSILHSPVGQLIIVAATADDVIALLILSEISVLSDPGSTALDYAAPVISAVCFTSFLSTVAVSAMPSVFQALLKNMQAGPLFDHALLSLILLVSFGLCACLHYGRCSHLFGAFLGGLCFCSLPDAQRVWRAQIGQRHGKWLLRLFFACTIGFPLSIAKLWTPAVVSVGFLFLISLVGKLALGFFPLLMPTSRNSFVEDFFVSGLSMCLWGDFALYVAVTAKSQGLLSESVYLSVMFSVLVSIIASSSALSWLLTQREVRCKELENEKAAAGQVVLAEEEG